MMLPTSSVLFAVAFLAQSFCAATPLDLGIASINATMGDHDVPAKSSSTACSNPIQRKEWRNMTSDEQTGYISAVHCLQRRPAIDPAIKEARSRFEEFQALHITIADTVHQLAGFLPWHREFIRLYEAALRDECGYDGASPYWDWSKDADSSAPIANSPIFDAITGFGGDGVPGTYILPPNVTDQDRVFPEAFKGCVQNGPFANTQLHLGPGHQITEHCLTRGFNDTMKQYLTSSAVADLMKSPNYDVFHAQLEGQPLEPGFRVHDAGHVLIGGDMSNFYSSPGEPLFFLHHGQLDRLWWLWQTSAPEHLNEVSGLATHVQPTYNLTLDFRMDFGTLAPRALVRDVMDIRSERNCYVYV